MAGDLDWLKERLEEAVAKLRGVTHKRMFGCDCYFAEGAMFAMIWKEGRIGFKLPDEAAYDELAKVKGTHPWKPGGKNMGKWLLVPEAWNEDDEALAKWAKRAHESRERKRAVTTQESRERKRAVATKKPAKKQ